MRALTFPITLVLAFVVFSSLVFAQVNCDQESFSETFTQNQITSSTKIARCTNSGNESTSLSLTGSGKQYVSLADDSKVIGHSGSQKDIIVLIDENTPIGDHILSLSFSDGSDAIPIFISVDEAQASQSGCQINPSLVSYQQTVQQGTKVPLPKITFNPVNCAGQLILTASSVSIQGGIVTTQGQKPVFISSVESDGINIELDTEGLNSQTYNSKLKINAFNKQFEIPFTVIITGGLSTSGDFNVGNLPQCSLTNNIININQTHSLVCSNIIPDVDIIPRVDNEYLRGIDVETTANQFSWFFQGKKFGNTKIYADFYYLGSPVGDSFSQEVKISSTSGQVPGTSLTLSFTPSLDVAQPNTDIAIQVLDNKSRNLVDSPELYVDSIPIQSDSKTFSYKFDYAKNYSLRASAPGYSDYVETIRIELQPIKIIITPDKGDSDTTFEIKTDIPNATLFLDEAEIPNPYNGNLLAGIHKISAIMDGFIDSETNITIEQGIVASSNGEFKKGVLQTFLLNKNTTWTVYYQEDLSSTKEIYEQGEGSKVEFEPTKKGTYSIEADGKTIKSNLTIESKLWAWYWYVILVIIISIVIYVVYKRNKSTAVPSTAGFGGNVQYR